MFFCPQTDERKNVRTNAFRYSAYDPPFSRGKNFENPTSDSDSPYPVTFGQTLWKIGISSVATTIDEKNLIQNFENPTTDSDSPCPITFG